LSITGLTVEWKQSSEMSLVLSWCDPDVEKLSVFNEKPIGKDKQTVTQAT